MSTKSDLQDPQKLQLMRQHYHEAIEAANRKFVENEKEQERLQKALRIVLK